MRDSLGTLRNTLCAPPPRSHSLAASQARSPAGAVQRGVPSSRASGEHRAHRDCLAPRAPGGRARRRNRCRHVMDEPSVVGAHRRRAWPASSSPPPTPLIHTSCSRHAVSTSISMSGPANHVSRFRHSCRRPGLPPTPRRSAHVQTPSLCITATSYVATQAFQVAIHQPNLHRWERPRCSWSPPAPPTAPPWPWCT